MAVRSTEEAVRALAWYGRETDLIEAEDLCWVCNMLFDILQTEPSGTFVPDRPEEETSLQDILEWMLQDAGNRGLLEEGITAADLFDTKLMGVLTPRPGEVIRHFRELYRNSPQEATDYFYRLSRDCNYIRTDRVAKDRKWKTKTAYGELDITINLSKPEKDPKAIAAALHSRQDRYPRCQLCAENEGYAGRMDHPARQNLRMIPLEMSSGKWYLQYSPYVYYNEHCIVLSGEHTPMKISRETFSVLLEFTEKFPHYMVGSNADLPIVGGSILTHEHFQGGRYTFPMENAPIREQVTFSGFEDIQAGIVKWPLSVIRLRGTEPERIVMLADRLLQSWRGYSDPEADILADSEGEPHNTITPIARRRGESYELDLVLRNNRTTEEHPLGLFHPHEEYHHIKKENIGLIEVMGLAVLPARLLRELEEIRETILRGEEPGEGICQAGHEVWIREIIKKYPEYLPENRRERSREEAPEQRQNAEKRLQHILEEETGIVFGKVLECCGVFRDTEEGRDAFRKFLQYNGGRAQ